MKSEVVHCGLEEISLTPNDTFRARAAVGERHASKSSSMHLIREVAEHKSLPVQFPLSSTSTVLAIPAFTSCCPLTKADLQIEARLNRAEKL